MRVRLEKRMSFRARPPRAAKSQRPARAEQVDLEDQEVADASASSHQSSGVLVAMPPSQNARGQFHEGKPGGNAPEAMICSAQFLPSFLNSKLSKY